MKLHETPESKYERGTEIGRLWSQIGYPNADEAIRSTVGWSGTLEEFEEDLRQQIEDLKTGNTE